MIGRIEALNYRCLRYVSQSLDDFHVLVGPNASGKTTFLDVVNFLARLLSDGLDAAIDERTANFEDLLWGRKGQRFELAIEAGIPEEHQTPYDSPSYDVIRYEVAIGLDAAGAASILDEQLVLKDAERQGASSSDSPAERKTLMSSRASGHTRNLMWKGSKGEYNVTPEVTIGASGEPDSSEDYWVVLRPNPQKTVFVGLNEAEFPASAWLFDRLRQHIQRVELDSRALRNPSPPARRRALIDGSGLPWMVSSLRETPESHFTEWLSHVRTVLRDVADIKVVERPEDKHRYIMLVYDNGLKVPSWMLSDGTLRMLALTIIPFFSDEGDVWLIEEPEISIHPLNVEAVMQSLQSVYDGQVLIATHSPTILALVKPESVLVFQADSKTGTTIIRGSEHPGLRDWHGEVSLGSLFAGGVLG